MPKMRATIRGPERQYAIIIHGLMGAVRTTQRAKFIKYMKDRATGLPKFDKDGNRVLTPYYRYQQYKQTVRALGDTVGIPHNIGKVSKVAANFKVYWRIRQRIDADNIIKGVFDALWPNASGGDRRVLSIQYEATENFGKEFAAITLTLRGIP